MVIPLPVASERSRLSREEAKSQFDAVVTNINRQFDLLSKTPSVTQPFNLNIGMKYIFRSKTDDYLRIMLPLDVPDESWLSPADPYGRMKLDRYKRRTSRIVPGLSMDWGKLNRIVAETTGRRDIVFTSIPSTKECWYATDDDYVAALIREHTRMAITPGFPTSDFKDVYEVSGTRKFLIDGNEFGDDPRGHAALIEYMRLNGTSSVTLNDDSGVVFTDLPIVPLASDSLVADQKSEGEIFAAAIQGFAAGMQNLNSAPAPSVASEPVAEAPKKRRGKAKEEAPVETLADPLAIFEDMMVNKQPSHVGLMTEQEVIFPDLDLIQVNEDASIGDLIEDISDGDDEAATPSGDS